MDFLFPKAWPYAHARGRIPGGAILRGGRVYWPIPGTAGPAPGPGPGPAPGLGSPIWDPETQTFPDRPLPRQSLWKEIEGPATLIGGALVGGLVGSAIFRRHRVIGFLAGSTIGLMGVVWYELSTEPFLPY